MEELASQVMTGMAPPDGYEDDVALVLFRHPEPLDLTFPADQGQLTLARAALRSWLVRSGLSRRMVQDVLVAAGEACANAIEHGHRDVPGTGIRLRAEATVTRLRVTVTDTGSWRTARPSPDPLRGHGIALMRALMEHVTIEAGEARHERQHGGGDYSVSTAPDLPTRQRYPFSREWCTSRHVSGSRARERQPGGCPGRRAGARAAGRVPGPPAGARAAGTKVRTHDQ